MTFVTVIVSHRNEAARAAIEIWQNAAISSDDVLRSSHRALCWQFGYWQALNP